MHKFLIVITIAALGYFLASRHLRFVNPNLEVLIEHEFKTRLDANSLSKYAASDSAAKGKMLAEFKESNKDLVRNLELNVREQYAKAVSKNSNEQEAAFKAVAMPISVESNGEIFKVRPVIERVEGGAVIVDEQATVEQAPPSMRIQILQKINNPVVAASASMAASLA